MSCTPVKQQLSFTATIHYLRSLKVYTPAYQLYCAEKAKSCWRHLTLTKGSLAQITILWFVFNVPICSSQQPQPSCLSIRAPMITKQFKCWDSDDREVVTFSPNNIFLHYIFPSVISLLRWCYQHNTQVEHTIYILCTKDSLAHRQNKREIEVK